MLTVFSVSIVDYLQFKKWKIGRVLTFQGGYFMVTSVGREEIGKKSLQECSPDRDRNGY